MAYPSLAALLTILSILTSSQNAHGSLLNRFKRGYQTREDWNNFFKHDAFIQRGGSFCSGTIIADQYILTAAHCVVEENSSNVVDISNNVIKVTVGITRLYGDTYGFQTVRIVEAVFLDKEYFNYHETHRLGDTFGDIAVLKLNYGVGLGINPRVEALRLPHLSGGIASDGTLDEVTEAYYLGSHLTYTGFGITGFQWTRNPKTGQVESFSIPADHLHFAEAKVLPNNRCPLQYTNKQFLDNKLCAELVDYPNSTTCPGDSGGALYHFDNKEIIGVISIGGTTCDSNFPTTYTKVVAFVDWIEAALNDRTTDLSRVYWFTNHPNYIREVRNNPQYFQIFRP